MGKEGGEEGEGKGGEEEEGGGMEEKEGGEDRLFKFKPY